MNWNFTLQPNELPPWWVMSILVAILLVQGAWLFIDARRRGRRAWLWGLWGVINTPTPLIVYLLVVVWRDHRRHNRSLAKLQSGEVNSDQQE